MLVHVLLYDAGQESEGIHSLELSGKVVVLMFEDSDDAQRYSGLLEAQDFPIPTVEELDRSEIESFCQQAGYEARFVQRGFVPSTEEERLLLSPPVQNKDVSNWKQDDSSEINALNSETRSSTNELEDIKNRLEGLL